MIWKQLKTVRDPEIPVNIVNLGLIYAAAAAEVEDGGKRIEVRMTLTAPGCSMSDVIKAEVERKLAALPEVREVKVEIVFDPPWDAADVRGGKTAARLRLRLRRDKRKPWAAVELRIVDPRVPSRSFANCQLPSSGDVSSSRISKLSCSPPSFSNCLRQSSESTNLCESRQSGSTIMRSSR